MAGREIRQFDEMIHLRLREGLRARLAGALPGEAAHARAFPPGYRRPPLPPGVEVQEAAVLLAITRTETGFRFPLIQRPASMLTHAGQIALPGGGREPGESPLECALREAAEEVGFEPSGAEFLGFLTPVVIPVSLYRVETAVVWVERPGPYTAQEAEVERIVLADPDDLLRRGLCVSVERVTPEERLRFPAFDVAGAAVWGATAIILCEFLAIWSALREGEAPPA